MKTSFDTERLILREILASDDVGMYELDSAPEVHRYLGNKPFTNIEQSREIIKNIQQQYVDNGTGRWAVLLKETGQFIGWAGLKLMRNINGQTDCYELGYRFMPKYWGKGYATEASKAFIDFGFIEMKLKVICAMTSLDNAGSQKVLIKAGFSFLNIFEFEGEYHNWYEIHNPNFTGL